MKTVLILLLGLVAFPTAALANPCGFEQSRELVITGYGVGATAVPRKQQPRLAEFAETAKHTFQVCIFAQVDKQGSDKANAKVAAARANSVKSFLVKRGVKPDAIKIAKQEEAFTAFGLLSKDNDEDRRVTVTHQ